MGDLTRNHRFMRRFGNSINFETIPAKLTYFLSEGFMGCILPFYNIFCVSLGLTSAQAGLITGVGYAAAAIAGPIWAALVDYTRHKKRIFVIMCIGSVTTVFVTPWVAQAVGKYKDHNVTCHLNISESAISNVNACTSGSKITNPKDLFYTFIFLSVLSRIFYVTLPNYIDALVIAMVKTRERETSFGPQRLFGSIGFGVANFVTGVIIDHYNPDTISNYTAAFYTFLPFSILTLPVGYILINQLPQSDEDCETSQKFSSYIQTYIKKPDTIFFLLTVTVSGMALNLYLNFVFLLMDDYMNSQKTTMTLVIVMSVSSEIIGYPFASKFIKLLGGPIPVIIVGIFSYLPRFVIMSYISNPWWALPVQLFHIFGLALSWTAQIEYAYQTAPKEILMTIINIIASIHYVASSAIANIIGGVGYHAYGGRVLFRVSGVVCCGWSICMVLYYGIKYYRTKKIQETRCDTGQCYEKDIDKD